MDGWVTATPSGKTTVGTVRFPPFTRITNSAALESSSMFTSVYAIPSRSSRRLRRMQYPHQVVEYIVSIRTSFRSIVAASTTGHRFFFRPYPLGGSDPVGQAEPLGGA